MDNNSHISKVWCVLENKLSGMPKPEETDLKALYESGIRAIVCLLEDDTIVNSYNENGFESLWLPVPDQNAPTTRQVEELVKFIDAQNEKGNKVAVHCKGGRGRTGTLIASYLISKGASFDEAMDQIEKNQPGAIKKDFQLNFLEELANK